MRERDIEVYLVRRVKELGGTVRKVQWVGRRSAPDRLVLIPAGSRPWMNLDCRKNHCIWVEVKNPETILTFPADARERAQAREHRLMRSLGQRVEVIGTLQQVDELLS